MDLISIRRQLLMQIGGAPELWNKTTITVPNDMTTLGDVYDWLITALPNYNSIFVVIRDNADISKWRDSDFIEASWTVNSTSFNMQRYRALNGGTNIYVEARGVSSANRSNPFKVYNGETFTVFYQ